MFHKSQWLLLMIVPMWMAQGSQLCISLSLSVRLTQHQIMKPKHLVWNYCHIGFDVELLSHYHYDWQHQIMIPKDLVWNYCHIGSDVELLSHYHYDWHNIRSWYLKIWCGITVTLSLRLTQHQIVIPKDLSVELMSHNHFDWHNIRSWYLKIWYGITVTLSLRLTQHQITIPKDLVWNYCHILIMTDTTSDHDT